MNCAQHLADTLASIERSLKLDANYAEVYGGPVVDGTHYSPSDRAISGVEDIYRTATPEQWEYFEWRLDLLYESLGLTWVCGILWRNEDAISLDEQLDARVE